MIPLSDSSRRPVEFPAVTCWLIAINIVDRVAPLPLAAIHSTHDEFVPVADVERMLKAANEPRRLWIVNASNHRFSDNLDEFDRQLLEAIAWVKAHEPR